MGTRWGLGPVFAYEWLTGSRSPRVYWTRIGFVLALLIVLALVWWNRTHDRPVANLQDFAETGSQFYLGLVSTQLALVLLVAPAATAGAICLDRSRGTLTHLLVTDLSDPEIVLGKLAARLVPTLALVLCALPVEYLASLLGGIDPVALLESTLITLGVAVLACSLALTLSVWGRKTQEVLAATYLVLIIWLLAYPTTLWFGWKDPRIWKLDPFQLAMAPYSEPGSTNGGDIALFLVIVLGLSVGLILIAVKRFRAVANRGDQPKRSRPRWAWRPLRRFSPSLDRDPVFWREWHRARPSTWSRVIWGIYYGLTTIFSLIALFILLGGTWTSMFVWLVTGFEVSIGLLLLSVDSATALSEERARGSLDILMTTPLTTWSIVWGKWRGAYQRVFSLAVWPVVLAAAVPKATNRFVAMMISLGLILAYGSAITSLGLALATWFRRLGWAVSGCVGIYLLITAGIFFACLSGIVDGPWISEFAMGSPFYGPIYPLCDLQQQPNSLMKGALLALGWIVLYSLAAGLLLLATLLTFDRSMGRAGVRQNEPIPRPREAAVELVSS